MNVVYPDIHVEVMEQLTSQLFQKGLAHSFRG